MHITSGSRSGIGVFAYLSLGFLSLALGSPGMIGSVQAQEAGNTADALEEIVVTGSRIARNPQDVAAPVQVTTAEDLKFGGNNDLGQILQELPALSALSGRAAFAEEDNRGSTGLSFADLRGLGSSRTLVLVDGKRHVAGGPNSQAVDLSSIPSALIKQVEVITGGASAIYGSDAVTGVVNIILEDEFEGVQIDAGTTQRFEGSEGANNKISFLAGTGFADGRGHLTVTMSRDTSDELLASDQPWRRHYDNVALRDNTGAVIGRQIVPNATFDIQVPNASFNLFGTARDAAGNPIDISGVSFGGQVLGNNRLGSFTDDGLSTIVLDPRRPNLGSSFRGAYDNDASLRYREEDFVSALPDVERDVFSLSGKYELTDSSEVYGEIKRTQVDTFQQSPGQQLVNQDYNILENPFVPADLRAALEPLGVVLLDITGTIDELGPQIAIGDRESIRFVGGIRGDWNGISYDAYYTYGKSDNRVTLFGERIDDHRGLAADAVIDPTTGQPACRINVPSAQPDGYLESLAGLDLLDPFSCAPYNPFGVGTSSQASADFLAAQPTFSDTIKQKNFGINFSSDTSGYLELPAGAISWAAGLEYRDESVSGMADELSISGLITGGASDDNFPENGYNVKEIFAEISVPVLESLDLDAAVRFADYSHAGNATAWKVGFNFAPAEFIRFRGTVSEAVRAPNISESFAPISIGGQPLFDPCDAENQAGLDGAIVSAIQGNCAALGLAPDFDAEDAVRAEFSVGGNPELTPEESESYTIGLTLEPTDGLSISLDYWNIEITDAISSVNPQTVVDLCFRNPAGDGSEPNCAAITRNNGSDGRVPVGQIIFVRSGLVNLSALESSGLDITASYNTEINGRPLNLSLVASQVFDFTEFPFQNDPSSADPGEGEFGRPELTFTASASYDFGPVQARWETRYIDSQTHDDIGQDTPGFLVNAKVSSVIYNDLFISKEFGDKGSNVYIGINNIFDEDPPIYDSNTDAPRAGQYDHLGQSLVAGFSYRL